MLWLSLSLLKTQWLHMSCACPRLSDLDLYYVGIEWFSAEVPSGKHYPGIVNQWPKTRETIISISETIFPNQVLAYSLSLHTKHYVRTLQNKCDVINKFLNIMTYFSFFSHVRETGRETENKAMCVCKNINTLNHVIHKPMYVDICQWRHERHKDIESITRTYLKLRSHYTTV